jgi:hypothetical protein
LSVIIGCLEGQNGVLEAVRWPRNGTQTRRPIRHVFNFIGADSNSDWLASSGVVLDKKASSRPEVAAVRRSRRASRACSGGRRRVASLFIQPLRTRFQRGRPPPLYRAQHT